MTKLEKAERRLRELRRLVMLTDDNENIDTQLIDAKAEVMRLRASEPEPVGPYSGLTRAELRATGTCETDWF